MLTCTVESNTHIRQLHTIACIPHVPMSYQLV